MAALGHLSPLYFLDGASGQIVASSDASWEGQFRETEPRFIHGKTTTYVSEMLSSLTLGQPTMVIAAPVRDSGGQLLGVLAAHANLEDLGEIMLERSGLGETGQTYLVNEAWLDMLGYTRDEAIGRPFRDLIVPEQRRLSVEQFARLKAVGEMHGVEYELVRKDGARLVAASVGTIVRDDRGRFLYTHCMIPKRTCLHRLTYGRLKKGALSSRPEAMTGGMGRLDNDIASSRSIRCQASARWVLCIEYAITTLP